jgi:DNA-binding transcriptional MerR regulator
MAYDKIVCRRRPYEFCSILPQGLVKSLAAFENLKRNLGVMFKTRKVRPDLAREAALARGDKSSAQRTYTSTDVAKIAQVSLRQLQWWDERKVVSPRHEGHKRIYLPEEVIEITVIAELRRKGFSLQKIRRVLRFLQREMGRRLADVLSYDSRLHLLTDGRSIYLEDQQDRIIDLLKNARQPMFLVCVSDQVKRLDEVPKKGSRSEMGLAKRARAAS